MNLLAFADCKKALIFASILDASSNFSGILGLKFLDFCTSSDTSFRLSVRPVLPDRDCLTPSVGFVCHLVTGNNGLVIRALDYQFKGLGLKNAKWLQG